MNGTIKKLIREKFFGFIIGDDGREYFFHVTALGNAQWDELEEGQAVTFDGSKAEKGLRAENVHLGAKA